MKLSAGDALKHMKPARVEAFELDETQLLTLQLRTLEVLETLVEICNRHGLRYVLSGGTSLGAIRHEGFIPWDDDADFSMPRADVEQLVEALQAECADELDVLTPASAHDYGLPFIQVRKRGTVAVKQEDFCTAAVGVCVDIFPIEDMHDNPLRRALHGAHCLALGFILSCRRVSDHREQFLGLAAGDSALTAAFSRKAAIGRLFSFASLDWWCARTDAYYSRCRDETSKFVGIPSGRRHFFGELYRRETFFPAATATFEGREWNVPGDWDAYLTQLYGDYRIVPAEDEREHHWYVRLELGETEATFADLASRGALSHSEP